MGLGGISPWSLLLILLIVLLLFGTKRLRNMGSDLGDAIKNFKSSMGSKDEEADKAVTNDKAQANAGTAQQIPPNDGGRVIDSEAVRKDTNANTTKSS